MSIKKHKEEFFDDGRVIANMNIDGMPRTSFKRTAFDGIRKVKTKPEEAKLTKEERRSVIGGIVTSYILFGIIVFGAFALFILFCIKVWFK
ncbi:MAG: hypothetical protein PHV32_04930 [Eubacteriales bacterium]|nr:hypothetical protein [Eubacteriales bacterium]